MRYLKAFENYSEPQDITQDIADSILPELEKLKMEKGQFTIEDFENYMKERGADSHTIDLTMSNIVNMGFDFDIEEEEDDSEDFDLKNTFY